MGTSTGQAAPSVEGEGRRAGGQEAPIADVLPGTEVVLGLRVDLWGH